MGNITMKMVVFIQVIGLMIFNLVLVLNYGEIHLNILESTITEKKKELERFFGLIIQFIEDNGKIML